MQCTTITHESRSSSSSDMALSLRQLLILNCGSVRGIMRDLLANQVLWQILLANHIINTVFISLIIFQLENCIAFIIAQNNNNSLDVMALNISSLRQIRPHCIYHQFNTGGGRYIDYIPEIFHHILCQSLFQSFW